MRATSESVQRPGRTHRKASRGLRAPHPQAHIDTTAAWHFIQLGKEGGVIGIGANGFYLQQTTGDRGSGARLGSFKESQAGVGPVRTAPRRATSSGPSWA